MLCGAKPPFLFTLLFYLLSGNDNFLSEKREERKEKREEYKKKRQSSDENCRFFLVEATGIEPVSEDKFPELSTSVVTVLRFPPPDARSRASGLGRFICPAMRKS